MQTTVMTVLGGYNLGPGGKLIRERVNLDVAGDYGADPVGDGTFRMVPSGDVVSFEERNRRLARK